MIKQLILLTIFYISYKSGVSVCFGCFSLHLQTQKVQRLLHPQKKKRKGIKRPFITFE